MSGFDWNGNGKKDAFDHYMDNKVVSEISDENNSTSNFDNKQKNNTNNKKYNFGWGWGVIVIVAFFLISFIADGASWVAIDRLLGFGLLAFLFFRWIST